MRVALSQNHTLHAHGLSQCLPLPTPRARMWWMCRSTLASRFGFEQSSDLSLTHHQSGPQTAGLSSGWLPLRLPAALFTRRQCRRSCCCCDGCSCYLLELDLECGYVSGRSFRCCRCGGCFLLRRPPLRGRPVQMSGPSVRRCRGESLPMLRRKKLDLRRCRSKMQNRDLFKGRGQE